jgi:hypothetical protein
MAWRVRERAEQALTALIVAGLLAWFAYGVASMLAPYDPYS